MDLPFSDQEVAMSADRPGRILRLKAVLGLTASAGRRYIARCILGTFRGSWISARCTCWREFDVARWLEDLEAYRRRS
jgi:hypothetical protein